MRYILIPIALLLVFMFPSEGISDENELDLRNYPNLRGILDDHELKDQLMEALKASRDNWENLAAAVEALSGQKQEDLIWQITVMPHLDRLEATSDILIEHIEYAYIAKTEFDYTVPEDMFKQYILVYRIDDEPVTRWRKMIFDRFRHMAGKTPAETARNVNEWVADNVSVRQRGFFGPRQAPDQVIRIGLGTEVDIAVLTAGILKALGVPSRFVRCQYLGEEPGGANWVEIYDGDKWIPLYPDDASYFGDFTRYEKDKPNNVTVVSTRSAFEALQITESYTDTGTIQMNFFVRGVPQENYEHYAVSVYNDGGWLPLDDLRWIPRKTEDDDEESDSKIHEVLVGDGTYMIQAGTRQRDGSVYFHIDEITVEPDDNILLEIHLDPPVQDLRREDLFVRELDKLPEWQLPLFDADGYITSRIVYRARYSVLAIFDINSEPSQRMIPLFAGPKEHQGVRYNVWGIHAGPVEEDKLREFIEVNDIDFPIAIDYTGEVVDSYEIRRVSEDEIRFRRLPSIMLFYNGTMLLWDEGFDLGIKQFVLDMIDHQEKLPW